MNYFQNIRAVALAICGCGLAASCGGGSNGGPQPVSGTVSYEKNVQPIFSATCALSGCHSGASVVSSGNLDLTAGHSYGNLVNQPTSSSCASQVPNLVRVKPGDTMGSMLWRKTAADPSRCLSPMPFGSSGLINTDRASFDTIEKWIEQGALDN